MDIGGFFGSFSGYCFFPSWCRWGGLTTGKCSLLCSSCKRDMPLGRSRVRNTKNGGQNSSGMSIWNRIGDDNNFQWKSNHVLTVSSYMEGVVRRLCHRQDAADWCNRPCHNHTLRSAAELCHDTAWATRVPVEHIPEHRKPALEWRRDDQIKDGIN